MKLTSEELTFLGVSCGLLAIIIALLLGNVDVAEALFKTKVDNRWIGY